MQSTAASLGPAEVGHVHTDVSGGWLRPAVFGAMDGLVTNISLIAGVGGGGASPHVVLLSGAAGLVAGAFSMALGEYTSVETQNNSVRSEVTTEQREIEKNPVAEQNELARMYAEMGMQESTAAKAAAEIHEEPRQAVRIHVMQELGVDPDDQPSPATAAVSSFFSFTVGAAFPLIPYLSGFSSLLLGLLAGALGLFLAGAIVARFTTRSWWANGIRQLLFGALAASATYLVGTVIGVSVT